MKYYWLKFIGIVTVLCILEGIAEAALGLSLDKIDELIIGAGNGVVAGLILDNIKKRKQ